jgi:hypothetical protein
MRPSNLYCKKLKEIINLFADHFANGFAASWWFAIHREISHRERSEIERVTHSTYH